MVKVLNGASGFGKGAIAEDFIHQYHSYYSNVFFLDGSSAMTWHLSVLLLVRTVFTLYLQ